MIETILTPTDLEKLRDGYERTAMTNFLSDTLPKLYEPSEGYIDAIRDEFWEILPREGAQERSALSIPDRERCLIALLASRGARQNLALHIYVGLAEEDGLNPAEVANILLLAGIYTGVDSFANGLRVAVATVTALKKLIDSGGSLSPASVVAGLQKAFPG